MLKMMRRNVLVFTGKLTNVLGAELIDTPDYYKRKDSKGWVVSMGPKCNLGKLYIGKCVVIGVEQDAERWISPTHSVAYGLREGWHAIMHEDKLIYEIEK